MFDFFKMLQYFPQKTVIKGVRPSPLMESSGVISWLGSVVRISRFSDRMDTIFRFLIVFLVFLIGGWPTLAYALPQGGAITSGTGTIDTSGSSLTVTQTTNKIIINWESFSIGNNESVIFVQPDSSSSALNNVLGTSRTVVEGNLAAVSYTHLRAHET